MTQTDDLFQLRYSRQIRFPGIGPEGQARITRSRVAIVGMGALGAALANHMVRAGVGLVRLIDRDFVEMSNLQRQMLYDEQDAASSLPKAVAAKQKLEQVNSGVTIEAVVADLTWHNAEEHLADTDLILDGGDNFTLRYLVNDVAVKHRIPWVYGGAVQAHGMTMTIIPERTPCLRCLFPSPPPAGQTDTCDTVGVIGPIIHVITGYQAAEALKILSGHSEVISPEMRSIDLWSNEYAAIRVENRQNPECITCGKRDFAFLNPPENGSDTVSLCGRDTIQISPRNAHPLPLEQLAERLEHAGRIELNRFLLRLHLEKQSLTIFPDGRVLVQGTADPAVARTLYDRYIGS